MQDAARQIIDISLQQIERELINSWKNNKKQRFDSCNRYLTGGNNQLDI